MLENLLKSVFGSRHERELRRTKPLVDEINRHSNEWDGLPDDALQAKTAEFGPDWRRGDTRRLLRRRSRRSSRQRLCGRPDAAESPPRSSYDVRLIGGVMLHEGKIAEMYTGEGKTLRRRCRST